MLKNYNVVITGGNAVNKKSRKKSILEIIPEYYGNIIFYAREDQPSRKEITDWIKSCIFFNSNKYIEIEDLKYEVEEEVSITSHTLKFYYETLTPQGYFKVEDEARKYKDYKFEEMER